MEAGWRLHPAFQVGARVGQGHSRWACSSEEPVLEAGWCGHCPRRPPSPDELNQKQGEPGRLQTSNELPARVISHTARPPPHTPATTTTTTWTSRTRSGGGRDHTSVICQLWRLFCYMFSADLSQT